MFGVLDRNRAATLLRTRIEHVGYPCLGARSVFHRGRETVRVFAELGSRDAAAELLVELKAFAAANADEPGFVSFIACFAQPAIECEREFEDVLWQQLQLLHDLDDRPWDPSVSHDPADDDFAFSVGGVSYFVVGLHPLASRPARRSDFPTLVFNLHAQFEALREAGRYERMRDAIRTRDEKLAGSVNPMVCDHGRGANACQYSGRAVSKEWEAPFEFRTTRAKAA